MPGVLYSRCQPTVGSLCRKLGKCLSASLPYPILGNSTATDIVGAEISISMAQKRGRMEVRPEVATEAGQRGGGATGGADPSECCSALLSWVAVKFSK